MKSLPEQISLPEKLLTENLVSKKDLHSSFKLMEGCHNVHLYVIKTFQILNAHSIRIQKVVVRIGDYPLSEKVGFA